MPNKYGLAEMKENMARAMGKHLDLSTKDAIEIANFLRGKSTEKAKAILNRVFEYTQAIPYKRFTNGLGHRPGKGIAAGRYPQKASKHFLDLIEQAEANAQSKGLSSDLMIIHLAAQKGPTTWHYGRQRRRQAKRTHLEIVVQEMEKPKKKEKAEKKQDPKTEEKQ